MTVNIHQWLVDHPIGQALILNAVIALPFLLAGIYWKFIIAFFTLPPQSLWMWFRKARLSTSQNRLAVLRRANKEPRYALRAFIGRLIFPFLWLGAMVFNLSTAICVMLLPTASLLGDHQFGRHILTTRGGQIIWFSIPFLLLFRSTLNVFTFASEYANFGKTQSTLLLKIRRSQQKLGLPLEPDALPTSLDLQMKEMEDELDRVDGGSYRQGAHVRHPKYGAGTVLRTEGSGDAEKVTVQFGAHGIKKLVTKFAQLQPM
jgi:hypothetical protein